MRFKEINLEALSPKMNDVFDFEESFWWLKICFTYLRLFGEKLQDNEFYDMFETIILKKLI